LEEEKNEIAQNVVKCINDSLLHVIETLAEKEQRKGDRKTIDFMLQQYGSDCRLLTFRILDELLVKEQKASKILDFSHILKKEIFIKSVFVCAIETIFYIGNVRMMHIEDILLDLSLNAFDFWRILNSFLKFDPLMPRVLTTHFREIEIKIASETAW
jgi:retinoblastoma-associated protein